MVLTGYGIVINVESTVITQTLDLCKLIHEPIGPFYNTVPYIPVHMYTYITIGGAYVIDV